MRRLILIIVIWLIAATIRAATITGTVRETTGALLPGVTIYEKGGSDSVVSDRHGHFAIEVTAIPTTLIAFLGDPSLRF